MSRVKNRAKTGRPKCVKTPKYVGVTFDASLISKLRKRAVKDGLSLAAVIRSIVDRSVRV